MAGATKTVTKEDLYNQLLKASIAASKRSGRENPTWGVLSKMEELGEITKCDERVEAITYEYNTESRTKIEVGVLPTPDMNLAIL